MTCKKNFGLALALLTGLALGEESRVDMRVEEPAPARVLPPIDPDQELGQWEGRSGSKPPLSPAENASLQDRRRKMETMLASIRAKREALEQADGGDKLLLARELEALVLDKDPETGDSEKRLKKAERQLRKSEQAQEKETKKALIRAKRKEKIKGNPKDESPEA